MSSGIPGRNNWNHKTGEKQGKPHPGGTDHIVSGNTKHMPKVFDDRGNTSQNGILYG